MIIGLCKEISNTLGEYSDLNFLDKRHGLVFANRVQIPGPNRPKSVLLPFEWGVTDCKESSCVTMDEKYRSVSWFESGDTILSGPLKTEVGAVQEADLRMVCWLNLKRINMEPTTPDRIQNLLRIAIQGLRIQSNDYQVTATSVRKIVTDSKSVLSKYGYSDKVNLMLFPYMVFAVDFKVQFFYNNCQPIDISPSC